MNSATSKKMVLVSVVLLAVISFYRTGRASEAGSLFKRLWGVGVIGVILSVASDFVPEIAGPFAGLVLLGSLTNGGDKAVQGVLETVSARVPAGPPAGVTGPQGHPGSTGKTGSNQPPAGVTGPQR